VSARHTPAGTGGMGGAPEPGHRGPEDLAEKRGEDEAGKVAATLFNCIFKQYFALPFADSQAADAPASRSEDAVFGGDDPGQRSKKKAR